MRTYFDASVAVPLFVLDPFTAQVERYVSRASPVAIVSDFAAAEVSSAIARRVRTGDLTAAQAQSAFANLDLWRARAEQVTVEPGDIRVSDQFIRRLDLSLRAPDAIHLAVALRLSVRLVTLDNTLFMAARAVGCDVIEP